MIKQTALAVIVTAFASFGAHAQTCLKTFHVDPTKTVALDPWLPGGEFGARTKCTVAERLRTELYINAPDLAEALDLNDANAYRDRLLKQLDASQAALETAASLALP